MDLKGEVARLQALPDISQRYAEALKVKIDEITIIIVIYAQHRID
jgi:hypothetical protein